MATRPPSDSTNGDDDDESRLPADDEELDGYVRVADLRPQQSPLRAAIEDAIREWPVPVPLSGADPKVLHFIRADQDRRAAWQANPICLHCTLPGSPDSSGWGERGVLCSLCMLAAEKREAELAALLDGRSVLDWLIHRFRPRSGRPRDISPDATFLPRFEDAKRAIRQRRQQVTWRSVAVEMEISESTLRDKRKRYRLTLQD